MIDRNLIDLAQLRAYFEDILPQMATFSLRSDPDAFAARFSLLEKRLSTGNG